MDLSIKKEMSAVELAKYIDHTLLKRTLLHLCSELSLHYAPELSLRFF